MGSGWTGWAVVGTVFAAIGAGLLLSAALTETMFVLSIPGTECSIDNLERSGLTRDLSPLGCVGIFTSTFDKSCVRDDASLEALAEAKSEQMATNDFWLLFPAQAGFGDLLGFELPEFTSCTDTHTSISFHRALVEAQAPRVLNSLLGSIVRDGAERLVELVDELPDAMTEAARFLFPEAIKLITADVSLAAIRATSTLQRLRDLATPAVSAWNCTNLDPSLAMPRLVNCQTYFMNAPFNTSGDLGDALLAEAGGTPAFGIAVYNAVGGRTAVSRLGDVIASHSTAGLIDLDLVTASQLPVALFGGAQLVDPLGETDDFSAIRAAFTAMSADYALEAAAFGLCTVGDTLRSCSSLTPELGSHPLNASVTNGLCSVAVTEGSIGTAWASEACTLKDFFLGLARAIVFDVWDLFGGLGKVPDIMRNDNALDLLAGAVEECASLGMTWPACTAELLGPAGADNVSVAAQLEGLDFDWADESLVACTVRRILGLQTCTPAYGDSALGLVDVLGAGSGAPVQVALLRLMMITCATGSARNSPDCVAYLIGDDVDAADLEEVAGLLFVDTFQAAATGFGAASSRRIAECEAGNEDIAAFELAQVYIALGCACALLSVVVVVGSSWFKFSGARVLLLAAALELGGGALGLMTRSVIASTTVYGRTTDPDVINVISVGVGRGEQLLSAGAALSIIGGMAFAVGAATAYRKYLDEPKPAQASAVAAELHPRTWPGRAPEPVPQPVPQPVPEPPLPTGIAISHEHVPVAAIVEQQEYEIK